MRQQQCMFPAIVYVPRQLRFQHPTSRTSRATTDAPANLPTRHPASPGRSTCANPVGTSLHDIAVFTGVTRHGTRTRRKMVLVDTIILLFETMWDASGCFGPSEAVLTPYLLKTMGQNACTQVLMPTHMRARDSIQSGLCTVHPWPSYRISPRSLPTSPSPPPNPSLAAQTAPIPTQTTSSTACPSHAA